MQGNLLLRVKKPSSGILRYLFTASPVTSDAVRTQIVTAEVSGIHSQRLKMRGWQIHNYGDVEELQLSDKIKMPQIRSSNECLVRVRSTTVNPIDVAMLAGYGAQVLNVMRCKPQAGIEFPLTLGREFCGELVQRGMGVSSQLTLGERVWGVVPLNISGSHAEYVAVPDYCLAKAPESLTNAEAASVLYAGLTAWSGLYITGGLGGICGATTAAGGGAKKRVLVLGGSGAVGSMAVQILKGQGAQVLATCSTDAVELVRGHGADIVVDYNDAAEMETLQRYTPYDIVLDCAGLGPKQAQALNFKFHQYITFSSPLLRNIDNDGLAMGLLRNVADLLQTNVQALSQQGGLVKWGFFVPAQHGIEFLQKLVERKKLLPVIENSYNFAELPEALKRVKDGHLRGKIVVNLNY